MKLVGGVKVRFCLLLVIFYARIILASDTDCKVSELDIDRYIKMDFHSFDQSENGWRPLAAKSCYRQAALVQEKYREANYNGMRAWERRVSSWHIGQMYAFDSKYSEAVAYFKQSVKLNDDGGSSFRWNDYVNASIAFLEKDRKSLSYYRQRLYGGNSPYNRMNLRIVDSFLRCFDSSYLSAYSLSCHPLETESERLRATAIEVESLKKLSDPIIESLKNYDVIAVGEVHGNQESLEFFEGLVESLGRDSNDLSVALEIPSSEQSRVDQFLKTLDINILKDSEFFNGEFQDGRASKAMLGLLEKLSEMDHIKVICFDFVGDGDAQTRDNNMAKFLYNAIRSKKHRRTLILTGGVHASLKKGAPWDLNFVPMLQVLDEELKKAASPKRLLNIGLKYKKLNTWACFETGCGLHAIDQPESPYSQAVAFNNYFTLEDNVEEQGYMSSLFIRQTTASPPALKRYGHTFGTR